MRFGMVVTCLLLSAAQAQAGDLVWHIKNNTSHHLQIKFDSTTRAYSWPGPNQAWDLNKGKQGNYNIACNAGEYICYAAWSSPGEKVSWGKGFTGTNGCTNCCYTCGATTEVITLHD
jgi:hypothetical protein